MFFTLFWPSFKKFVVKPKAEELKVEELKIEDVKVEKPEEEETKWRCRTCDGQWTREKFSSSELELNKEDNDRNCKLCVVWHKEIGPVLDATLRGVCMYCNKKHTSGDCLTKEHIIPRSLGGNYKIKGVCQSCNRQRGNSMKFKPYTSLVKLFPAIQYHATKQTTFKFNSNDDDLLNSNEKKRNIINFLSQEIVNCATKLQWELWCANYDVYEEAPFI